jgi:hypothetical protein
MICAETAAKNLRAIFRAGPSASDITDQLVKSAIVIICVRHLANYRVYISHARRQTKGGLHRTRRRCKPFNGLPFLVIPPPPFFILSDDPQIQALNDGN